jgi:hypothetical protein
VRAEHRELAAADRFGEARLTAGKDGDQRHAERGRQMQQTGIDTDNKLRVRDKTYGYVKRIAPGAA